MCMESMGMRCSGGSRTTPRCLLLGRRMVSCREVRGSLHRGVQYRRHSIEEWSGRHPKDTGRRSLGRDEGYVAGDDGRKVGVVIVDHGSKRAAANDMLDGVVEMYRDIVMSADYAGGHEDDGRIVCVTKAHMELCAPSILDAVRTCVEKHGANVVIVAPFFLSRGRHIQEDIPRLVREAEVEISQEGNALVECIVAEPLGLDAGVVNVMKKRVDEALSSVISS